MHCLLFAFIFLLAPLCSHPQAGIKALRAPVKKVVNSSIPQHAKPLVILDAGHGGTDEGAKVGQFMEKKLTLSTVMLLKKYLGDLGYRVILTRNRDVYVPLPRRVSLANHTGHTTSKDMSRRHAVIFVSVHYNASQSHDAKGIEVFYNAGSSHGSGWRSQASKGLASAILSSLITQTRAESRGVKKGNFHVIRETEMPAVLVEGGFITNLEERAFLRDKGYIDKIAKGIALGIDKYMMQ